MDIAAGTTGYWAEPNTICGNCVIQLVFLVKQLFCSYTLIELYYLL